MKINQIVTEAANAAQQAAIAVNMKKAHKKPKDIDEGSLNEFAPGGGDDNEDQLRYLAKQWFNSDDATIQRKIQHALIKIGYHIDYQGEEQEGVQLIPAGKYGIDWDDNDIIYYNPEDLSEGKTGPGLWANIHAKQERIKHGSGERMRKPGSKGAPTDANFRAAKKTESVAEGTDKNLYKTIDNLLVGYTRTLSTDSDMGGYTWNNGKQVINVEVDPKKPNIAYFALGTLRKNGKVNWVESGDDSSREVLHIVKTFSKDTFRKGVSEGRDTDEKILRLFTFGKSPEAIADALGIDIDQVKDYINNRMPGSQDNRSRGYSSGRTVGQGMNEQYNSGTAIMWMAQVSQLAQAVSQLSPEELVKLNDAFQSFYRIAGGAATGAGAVGIGGMFYSLMKDTLQAAKSKAKIDTEEILALKRQIISIHKMLKRVKTDKAIAKYQNMLKQAFEVLKELEARKDNQVAEAGHYTGGGIDAEGFPKPSPFSCGMRAAIGSDEPEDQKQVQDPEDYEEWEQGYEYGVKQRGKTLMPTKKSPPKRPRKEKPLDYEKLAAFFNQYAPDRDITKALNQHLQNQKDKLGQNEFTGTLDSKGRFTKDTVKNMFGKLSPDAKDVKEATGDPKFDQMLKGITGKKAVAKQQKTDTKQQSRDAFNNMFGGGNPADSLGIRKKGVSEDSDPCWDNYKQVGMKQKGGKKVPNCVPVEEEFNLAEELQKLDDAKYHGKTVPLNKPMAGDVAKSKVYVKDPSTGNVKKVNFGQKGVRIKKNNPGRRKSFRARHNCDNPGPKTKAKYWSCRAW